MCGKRCARWSFTIRVDQPRPPHALAPLRRVAASEPGPGAPGTTTARCGSSRDGDSVRARLLDVLLVVKDAQLDGTWGHLKACANDDCQWAFYDRSRNHGGTWCDMATCGNKLKNRDFRAAQTRRGDQVRTGARPGRRPARPGR